MGIQKRYSAVTDSVIATYNASDIFAQTGIINLYGYNSNQSGSYILNNNAVYSGTISTGQTTTSASPVLMVNSNFDIKINRPTLLKGTVTINIPTRVGSTIGATGQAAIELRKIRGSTNTLVAAQSGSAFSVSGATNGYFVDTMTFDVTDELYTHDDTLRLNVTMFGNTNGGGTGTFKIGHDPKNRATETQTNDSWGSVPTTLIISLPTKVDI